jgi:hypothetical protein
VKGELKLWNGRAYCCFKPSDKRWKGSERGASHAYVAAYSVADALRVITEYCGHSPGRTEITKYWNEGCWGNSMDGVEPERGMWIAFERGEPVRVV